MENKSHAFMAGLFTLVLLAAVAASVYWFNRDNRERVPYDLVAHTNVTGLNPESAVRYRGLAVGKVESINITGFQTEDQAVNSEYDDTTKTITSFGKWRGAGDASSTGTYLFRHGTFSLVQYDVDASYDGKVNPQTILDYNTAP